MHSAGTGSDIKQPWMLALTAICVLAVVVAVWARVGFGWPGRRGLRSGALVASIALPVAFVAWLPGGPLGRDWALRAGTPLRDLAAHERDDLGRRRRLGRRLDGSSGTPPATTVSAFTAAVSGTRDPEPGARTASSRSTSR